MLARIRSSSSTVNLLLKHGLALTYLSQEASNLDNLQLEHGDLDARASNHDPQGDHG
jgi:hypothetical protein